jgi:hypothetical protein
MIFIVRQVHRGGQSVFLIPIPEQYHRFFTKPIVLKVLLRSDPKKRKNYGMYNASPANESGTQNNGGLLDEMAKTKEIKDPKALWDALFKMFDAMLLETPSDELDFRMRVTPLMHSLRLIQAFNWPAWKEPYPTVEQARQMSLEDALKHIFRIRRQDRFGGGLFDMEIQSGLIPALCLVVKKHANGGIAPKVL